MNKYVVFDFDGTLVDSKAVIIAAYNQLADKYRFKQIDADNIEYLKQLSTRERIRALQVPFYKVPFLTREFIGLYKKSIHSISLIDGMADVLLQLERSGYKTAIVSSNAVSSIQQFLQNNQLTHITAVYCSSHIFGKDKIIQKFLKKNRLRNTDVLYVGDEQRNIIACKRTNIPIIWVPWGSETEAVVKSHQPDFIATTPEDILRVVRSHWK